MSEASEFHVIDADAHFFEVLDELSPYLEDDDPWRRRFERVQNRMNLFPSSSADQRAFGRINPTKNLGLDWHDENMSSADVRTIMEYIGVDEIVLLSQLMLTFARLRGEDARPVALANAYVDYMLDQVLDPDDGVHGLAVLPYQDPDASVELIERVGDERAIVGACLITAGPEPPLGHRRYDPIYEAAEDRGLPMVFHTGGAGIDDFYIRGYETFLETHSLAFLWNNMSQLVSIVVQGVPEKYPDLDIVFQESGVFWVPLMMNRLDTEYLKRQSEAPLLNQLPSKYMREFYYGIQPLEQPQHDERHLESIIEMIGGVDRLMYASDYPHWDYDPPSVVTNRSFLTDDEKARILSGTAQEVFGL